MSTTQTGDLNHQVLMVSRMSTAKKRTTANEQQCKMMLQTMMTHSVALTVLCFNISPFPPNSKENIHPKRLSKFQVTASFNAMFFLFTRGDVHCQSPELCLLCKDWCEYSDCCELRLLRPGGTETTSPGTEGLEGPEGPEGPTGRRVGVSRLSFTISCVDLCRHG